MIILGFLDIFIITNLEFNYDWSCWSIFYFFDPLLVKTSKNCQATPYNTNRQVGKAGIFNDLQGNIGVTAD